MGTLTQRRTLRLFRAARERFRADDLGTQASAWAYTAYLSLFPVMLLALSVAGYVLAGRTEEDLRELFETLPGIGPLLERYLDGIVVAREGLGLIALAGVVWTATGLAGRTTAALARIFRIPEPGLVRRRVRALVSMLALGGLLLAALALSSFVAGVELPGTLGLLGRIGSLLGVAVLELAFFLLSYRLLTPDGGPPVRDHVPGAIAMTVGWNVLKLIGGLVVARVVVRASALYGTIGAVFGVLVFLRLAAVLYLGAAELSALLREQRREPAGL